MGGKKKKKKLESRKATPSEGKIDKKKKAASREPEPEPDTVKALEKRLAKARSSMDPADEDYVLPEEEAKNIKAYLDCCE